MRIRAINLKSSLCKSVLEHPRDTSLALKHALTLMFRKTLMQNLTEYLKNNEDKERQRKLMI